MTLRKSSIKAIAKRYIAYKKSIGALKRVSEEVRTKSKTAISLLRRRNDRQAYNLIKSVEQELKAAAKLIRGYSNLSQIGFYKDAVEEYVEAKVFYSYLTGQDLSFPKTVGIELEEQIGGIADFTGELVRHAVTVADKHTYKQIDKYRQFIEDIIKIFAQVSFSGKLRGKYDDMERNLKRLEEILYRLRIR